jgi:cytochrome c-type biogenesis protein CcmE
MKKKQRLYFILFVLASLGCAVGLSLYALRDNLSFFYSPKEVAAYLAVEDPRVAAGRRFRLGGLVKTGTVEKTGETVRFTVTDGAAERQVQYRGIVPDLFREGQGVVAMGRLNEAGVFVAEELLAKHDENYMPPEVAKALQQAHEEGVKSMQAYEAAADAKGDAP